VNNKLPILDVTTLRSQVDHTLYSHKLITGLCGVFGLIASLLACIGIYGTIAYSVARRTVEIGIRMAVGARRRHVLWLVLRDSLISICAGLAIGLPLARFVARSIKSFVFGVPPVDPLAIAAAACAIAALSLLAGYLPARRATRVDPMRALHYE
jgi:ABC-type antimicrobial peptide transport system permease subunit